MKFKVRRTSEYNDEIPPCDGSKLERYSFFDVRSFSSYEEFDAKFGYSGTWLSKGINHCINDDGYIQRELPNKRIGWFIELNSLDELMEFQSKYGDIIIQTCYHNPNIIEIEIYDGYRGG